MESDLHRSKIDNIKDDACWRGFEYGKRFLLAEVEDRRPPAAETISIIEATANRRYVTLLILAFRWFEKSCIYNDYIQKRFWDF